MLYSALIERLSLLPGLFFVGVTSGCGANTAPTSAATPEEARAPVQDAERPAASAASSAAERGPRPPDFELDTLDGGSVRLSDHLGRDVVLIDFWATYCDPCLTAMPHLDALYRKHKDDGFVVLGISIDGPESAAQVRTEIAKLGVSFPILLDRESQVVALYNPKTSAPYSVLIDRSGRVVTKQEGYTTGNAAQLERDIERAMVP